MRCLLVLRIIKTQAYALLKGDIMHIFLYGKISIKSRHFDGGGRQQIVNSQENWHYC